MLDLCLAKNSRDNMTACVVAFPGVHIGEGGGVAARWQARNPKSQDGTENDDPSPYT